MPTFVMNYLVILLDTNEFMYLAFHHEVIQDLLYGPCYLPLFRT